jgi:hypothetical protein
MAMLRTLVVLATLVVALGVGLSFGYLWLRPHISAQLAAGVLLAGLLAVFPLSAFIGANLLKISSGARLAVAFAIGLTSLVATSLICAFIVFNSVGS